MNTRLVAAMGAYAALALLAGLTLDGLLRNAVWILMAGLAVKTWIAYKAGWYLSAKPDLVRLFVYCNK